LMRSGFAMMNSMFFLDCSITNWWESWMLIIL
jgi:hypothetical protein